jgi:hypothetical protein
MLTHRHMLIIAAGCGLAACTQSSQLYIASHTVVGVNAAVNTQQTSGHLVIGYDRVFVTNPPKSVSIDDASRGTNPEPRRDAMSVMSCSELVVTGIFLTGFTEHLATGQAAQNFATQLAAHPEQGNKFFDCSNQ